MWELQSLCSPALPACPRTTGQQSCYLACPASPSTLMSSSVQATSSRSPSHASGVLADRDTAGSFSGSKAT
jgi:hypothetical protein